MRPSISVLLSALLATIAAGGLIVLAASTQAGTAPGNGEKIFDAPGCQPVEYDGPGLTPRYPLHRDCPTPTPVIVATRISRAGSAWRVTWDGSRSFDPVGGRLTRYAWSTGFGPQRIGARITVLYTKAGLHSVELYVTDDSGSTGTARQTVRLG